MYLPAVVAILIIFIVFFLSDPRGMNLFLKVWNVLNIKWSFFFIPLWLLPFGLAVVFEAQTEHVPTFLANIFFFSGRYVFPLGYTYKHQAGGFVPLLSHPNMFQPAHTWDLIIWLIVSVLYGLFTRRIRTGRAFAMAPLLILALLAVFHFFAWQFGYIHWGLPTRVVG